MRAADFASLAADATVRRPPILLVFIMFFKKARLTPFLVEDVIDRTISAHPASSGDNLVGFSEDLHHSFGTNPAFASADIAVTTEPSCLFRIKLVIAPDLPNIQAVTSALLDAWQFARYSCFEASSVAWFREATCLRFVTVISEGSFCVTGVAFAHGPGHAALIQQLERDFGTIASDVRPFPGGLPAWAA